MANYQFTSDLIDDVLFRIGEPTDGTSDFNATALERVNRAYRAVWMGGGEFVDDMNEPWLWLKKDPPGTLVLDPLIDTGTVAVTQNSATVTFSSAPANSVAGRFFVTDDDETVYRVSAHTGGVATATLDSVYVGTTNAAATYRLMKLEYTLPNDCLRIIAPMRVQNFEHQEIEQIDLVMLDRNYPLYLIEGGLPTHFALVTESKVRFNRYGGDEATTIYRTEFDYLAKPADLTDSGSEEPLVPLQYRHILSDLAVYTLWVDKNDERAAEALARAKAGLLAMRSDNRARMSQASKSFAAMFQRGHPRHRTVRVLIAR